MVHMRDLASARGSVCAPVVLSVSSVHVSTLTFYTVAYAARRGVAESPNWRVEIPVAQRGRGAKGGEAGFLPGTPKGHGSSCVSRDM